MEEFTVAHLDILPAWIGVADYPVDQGRYEHLATSFHQPSGKLGLESRILFDSGERFRELSRIGNDDCLGNRFFTGWAQEQSFGIHAVKDGPSDGMNFVTGCPGD